MKRIRQGVNRLLTRHDELNRRSSGRINQSSRIAFFSSLLLVTTLLGAGTLYFHRDAEFQRIEELRRAHSHLGLFKAELEAYLNKDLYRVKGLAAIPLLGQENDQAVFQQLAAALGGEDEHIISLQLAEDAVVSHVWPYERNKAAIGHDLLADPARRAAAQRAIDERRLWIAGPVTLKQGGVALIGRYPIFTQQETSSSNTGNFWGFASILIDWSSLIASTTSSIPDLRGFEIGLRGKDGFGSEGEQIYGQPEIFASNPATLDVSLPGGTWQLAIIPSQGWVNLSEVNWLAKAAYFAATCLLSLGFFLWLKSYLLLRYELRDEKKALEKLEERFKDSIESMPAALAVFDSKDNLVTFNSRYEQIYAEGASYTIQVGARAKDIFRNAIDGGMFHFEGGEPDRIEAISMLTNRLDQYRDEKPWFDEVLAGGRVLRTIQHRTRMGNFALIQIDVTDLHRSYRQSKQKFQSMKRDRSNFAQLFSWLFENVEHQLKDCAQAVHHTKEYPESNEAAPHYLNSFGLRRALHKALAFCEDGRQLSEYHSVSAPAQSQIFSLDGLIETISKKRNDHHHEGSGTAQLILEKDSNPSELVYGNESQVHALIEYMVTVAATLSRGSNLKLNLDKEKRESEVQVSVGVKTEGKFLPDNYVETILESVEGYNENSTLYGLAGIRIALLRACAMELHAHVETIREGGRATGIKATFTLFEATPIEKEIFGMPNTATS
ncbi:CHASE domain-containing protein [Marinobacter fonticola]|uniref:CHASE domain-containing protein n=1 Tax=Marinobacter fonticola TaxID=2603215 RepID=UPI0011E66C04|nr:CHASE domain-containing protein [Marinobacter fonticola]